MANFYDTSKLETNNLGQSIDEMMTSSKNERMNFERKWYDNNFFDDGHHFRYLSRLQNKIVDLSDKSSIYSPMRAIPKASRQIRGIANLLTSQDYVPVVYPEKVEKANYPGVPSTDENGQQILSYPDYERAKEEAKQVAKRSARWIEDQFKLQELKEKTALMAILSAKNYISYLQITPDYEKERIKTIVRDAFDVYIMAQVTDIEDSPFVIIAHPKTIAEIKANKMFDPEKLKEINPDNRQASSEIKEAYMRGRYGREFNSDTTATIILKEAYLKEHLNEDNFKRIKTQQNAMEILKDKEMGDCVYRQVFVAGNIEVYDKYTDLPGYPLVDFRYEPGPMYGVSMIERFIPSNKSLDMIVSRVERYAHTMTVGTWLKRSNEKFQLTNAAGGQVINYKSVPPQQGQMAPLPGHVFNFIELLNSFIEEQGVTTATLGKIPPGVKAAKAIESLKESEFANLIIAQKQYKNLIRRVAEKMLDYADKAFVSPQTVYDMEKGEPQYFDVIGKSALEKRKQLKVPVEGDVTPISKDYKVDIEVETGMGYTREGQRMASKEIADYIVQLAAQGLIPQAVVSKVLHTMLETYSFGPASEILEDMDKYEKEGMLTDQQMDKIKIGVAEVLKDAEVVGPGADEKLIQTTKIGAVEALKDTGLIEKDNSGGIEAEKVKQEMMIKREEADSKLMRENQAMEIERAKAMQDMELKEDMAMQNKKIKAISAVHKMRSSKKKGKDE